MHQRLSSFAFSWQLVKISRRLENFNFKAGDQTAVIRRNCLAVYAWLFLSSLFTLHSCPLIWRLSWCQIQNQREFFNHSCLSTSCKSRERLMTSACVISAKSWVIEIVKTFRSYRKQKSKVIVEQKVYASKMLKENEVEFADSAQALQVIQCLTQHVTCACLRLFVIPRVLFIQLTTWR